QGLRHSGRPASHRAAARDPPRDRTGDRRRTDHDSRPRPGRLVDQPGDAGGSRAELDRARGPRLCACRDTARPSHDGHQAQCRDPDRRVHVVGERPGPGRDRRPRHAAGGRVLGRVLDPDRLLRVRRVRVPHPRTLRHGRRERARPLPWREERSSVITPLNAILWIPAFAVPLLALVPNYRAGAAINVIASGLTFAAGVSLLFAERVRSDILIIDDFNIFLVTVTTFVAFTTSIFSASYIGHELETGRLTPVFLRFYHALYQAMIGAMNVALVANNIGLMWVGVEVATLSTVMMVGIYRTPEAVEAAWKYFI